jgi:hypothetical protein
LDATTGLGAITFTDTTPGLGFFDIFVDLSLSKPFSNEFAATGGGSPSAAQSWQIDVSDYWCNAPACQFIGLPSGTPDPNDPTANIIANVAGEQSQQPKRRARQPEQFFERLRSRTECCEPGAEFTLQQRCRPGDGFYVHPSSGLS